MRKILSPMVVALALAWPAAAQVTGPQFSFIAGTAANPDEVNTNFTTIYQNALNRTGGTMSGPLTTQMVLPALNNTYDLGSVSVLYRTGYLRNSLVLGQATANYTISWNDVGSARSLTIADPGGPDTFAFLAATQTFTNKTLTAPVLSGSVTGTYTLAGTPTITAPTLSGTVSGTYTLGGSPSIAATAITSGILALARGGTAADLSATGGASQFLKQGSVGGAVTVVRPAVADLSDGAAVVVTSGSYADPAWITSLAPAKLATGTIGSGVTWNGVAIGTQFGGLGANNSAVAQGAVIFFNGTGTTATLAAGTAGSFLRTGGVGANPTWSTDGSNLTTLNASNLSSGTLPTGRLAGTYSNILTFSSGSNSISGSFLAPDGSPGIDVPACNTTSGGTLVFKKGILVSGC